MSRAVRVPPASDGEASHRRREALWGLLFVLPPLAVLVTLVVLPALDAVRFSLGLVPADNVSYTSGLNLVRSDVPTLQVFRDLFANPVFGRNLSLTLFVTFASMLLLAVLSYALALYGRFGVGRLRSIARTLALLPMFVPGVIAAYALITFYGDNGLFEAMLGRVGLPYETVVRRDWGVVLGSVWTGVPFAVLMLSSGLDAVSEEQIEAARDAGAGFWTVLWRVVLPLNLVPLLIVLTFTFIGVFGSFTVPYLLGPTSPQMLGVSMQLYFGSFRQPQVAVAMAVFSFVVCAFAGALYVLATTRQQGRRA
ncbi:spermidine/putrescine ABC transporter permease (plasmid) [Deinococcus aetherius]|uniref:Spermidine/putrescine ABC transporter permease n=1 Tax=Deinococcus aetherius TaxID=200252 RepID=A0ABM8AKU6_9DEIO|nr:ABC transporter permease subunit [Deinococcus aetherius]BDP44471.1 spermidine/putrescine ABC transporter permease [Deinococcus aetherius]